MARRKQVRFAEFNDFPNCVNNDPGIKGNWSKIFTHDQPLYLELGCGKGDMTIGLARLHPDRNYLGIDIKSPRMWVGANTAMEEGLKNVGFLRAELLGLREFFNEHEVSGIWITFPDPFPRKKGAKRRMTHERFLSQYLQILKPGNSIQFKTDNNDLFEWTMEHFAELNESKRWKIDVKNMTRDLHSSDLLDDETGITTDYERKFMGHGLKINYMAFVISAV